MTDSDTAPGAAGDAAPSEGPATAPAAPEPAAKAAAEAAEKPAAKPPGKPPAKPAAPARELPSEAEIAAWIEGADLPTLPALFELPLPRFDALVMQIRKEELLPQHWQVISNRELPGEFSELPEARRLRARHGDPELAARRLAALEVAWRELGGKQPSLWTVADLFAALRRIIAKKLEVDLHDLFSAARDVWAGLTLPHGREQLEVLWACVAFVRQKTKK